MVIDEPLARQWLSNVSYYRLSAYWYPARVVEGGVRTDTLRSDTTFVSVAELYEADRKLRTLVHDGVERIEVALRVRVGEILCAEDPLRYRCPDFYRDEFDLSRWLSTADKRVARATRHNEAIKHYRDKYGGRYPFWVLADVLDLSDTSRLYEGLSRSVQTEIAQGLGFNLDLGSLTRSQRRKVQTSPPLVRWLEQLTVVRNTCAHHGRLWNKSFTPAPTAALRTVSGLESLPVGQSERIYGVLVLMSHLLRVVSPGTTWPEKAAGLVRDSFITNPLVMPGSLGIPDGWSGRF